jgi:hypothetical protein
MNAPTLFSRFPAKAGIQIQPERLAGFTWAPTFVGETGKEGRDTMEANLL